MFKVAVVGMGWWGRIIVPLLRSSKKFGIDKVVEIDPADLADFARRHEVEVLDSYDAVLKDRSVQGVVLCTPHTQHADQVVAAAQAGKHVFCEKPLSMTRADALRAIDAVNRNGVALAVGHERRFEPPIIELMRVVHSGEIGVPLQVEANFSQDKFLALAADNWRLSNVEAPAGPMTATGIHLLDLAVGVFGEAASVLASVRQLGSQLVNGDTLAVLVSFRGGGHALISAILATPFDGRFAVYGSRGWVEVRDKTHPEQPTGWTYTKVVRGEERVVREYPPAPNVLANLDAFADAAEGRAPYPVPQSQMIANISALEAVFRSAASGRLVEVEG
jgi:predicted dehydrogenase